MNRQIILVATLFFVHNGMSSQLFGSDSDQTLAKQLSGEERFWPEIKIGTSSCDDDDFVRQTTVGFSPGPRCEKTISSGATCSLSDSFRSVADDGKNEGLTVQDVSSISTISKNQFIAEWLSSTMLLVMLKLSQTGRELVTKHLGL